MHRPAEVGKRGCAASALVHDMIGTPARQAVARRCLSFSRTSSFYSSSVWPA